MAALTHSYSTYMRIDLKSFDAQSHQIDYSDFVIDAKRWVYKLHFSDDLGPGLNGLHRHNRATFSAKDRGTFRGTADVYKGGWWYFDDGVRNSNLNGIYYPDGGYHEDGIIWVLWKTDVLKESKMMIRPNGKGEFDRG